MSRAVGTPSTTFRRPGKRRITRFLIVLGSAALGLIVLAAAAFFLLIKYDHPALQERKVKKLESMLMSPAPQGVIVLAGSSYFDLWETSGDDLAPLETVNVGIAGTKIGEQLAFVDRLVYPFNPRALVLYAGSNDINGVPFASKDPDDVVAKVKEYVATVHEARPGLPIYYVAITEAPIREGVRRDIQAANSALSTFARETGEITFIDPAPALLTADGDIDRSLFRSDRLHLNEEGYAKFSSVIKAALLEDFPTD